jgi:hypothetical protein
MMQPETRMTRFAQSRIAITLSRLAAIAALLVATPGIVVTIGWPAYAQAGYALVAGGLALAIWLPLIGPFRLGGTRPTDEFDRMIQMRGWLAACASASFAAIFGMMMLLALGLMGHWSGALLLPALGALLSYLLVLLAAVPTLVIASGASGDDED